MKPIVKLMGARVSKGLEYYPRYEKTSGKPVSQRLVIPFMHTQNGFTLSNGTEVQSSTISDRLTAWGRAADRYAKILSPGMEFSCEAELHQFVTQYKKGGVLIQGPDGSPCNVTQYGLTIIPGTMWLGRASSKLQKNGLMPIGGDGKVLVEMLLAAAAGGADKLREFVNLAAQGPALWEQNLKQIQADYTPGMTQFGWAKVVGGTQTAYVPPQAAPQAAPQAGAAQPYGYQDLINVGWTPQQIFADKLKRHLIPPEILAGLTAQSGQVPPPPAAVPTPPAAVPPPPANTSVEAGGPMAI